MYSLYIRHVGLRVVTASDGEEALVKANRLMPDVIVMDLTMPGMDGWTATRVMKRDPRLRSIPVIALTGHAMMGAEDDALAAGCDRYVVKPCLPEELVAVIRELVAPGGGTRRRA